MRHFDPYLIFVSAESARFAKNFRFFLSILYSQIFEVGINFYRLQWKKCAVVLQKMYSRCQSHLCQIYLFTRISRRKRKFPGGACPQNPLECCNSDQPVAEDQPPSFQKYQFLLSVEEYSATYCRRHRKLFKHSISKVHCNHH